MAKYKLLSDLSWLLEKYEKEKLSTTQIAELIGCTRDGVRAALIRNGINLRTSNESNAIRFARTEKKSKKYNLLNDAVWLKEKYEVEGLSTPEIAILSGAKTSNSVAQALHRYGITIRNCNEAAYNWRMKKGFDDEFNIHQSVFAGCLLGDGYMQKSNKTSDTCHPSFQKKNIHYDHLVYVASFLFKKGGKDRIKEGGSHCNGKFFSHFQLKSFVNQELVSYYNEWYPKANNYKKVVPKSVEIDAVVLLHWFLDDGYAGWRVREGKKTNQVRINFCSESFTKEDQEELCRKTNDKFSLGMKVFSFKCGTGWRIKVPQSQAKNFFDIIGPPPVASLAYKWKIP